MIFWKKYPKKKPKKRGWYLCTIEVGQQRYVMELWYIPESDRWRDNIRQNVFDLYEVYSRTGDLYNPLKRLYNCELTYREDDVVAWRRNPKPFMKGFKKENLDL